MGLLHASVAWIRRPPGQRRKHPKSQLPMGVNVGGGRFGRSDSFQHLAWKHRAIRIGDEITVRFVKARSRAAPAERHTWSGMDRRGIRPVLYALQSAYEMVPVVRGAQARALQRDLKRLLKEYAPAPTARPRTRARGLIR